MASRSRGVGAALVGAVLAMNGKPGAAWAADKELKIGVVAAESGSFVSAGNTIVAAAKLAADKINGSGGIHVGNDVYKIKLYIRDNRTDVNVTVAAATELVNDVGVSAIWGTETHDYSIAMAKITGPAKVLQFSGNSSLGSALDAKSVAPGGLDSAITRSSREPQEWQRSGSTAKGAVLVAAHADDGVKARPLRRLRRQRCHGPVSLLALRQGARGRRSRRSTSSTYPPDTTDFLPSC